MKKIFKFMLVVLVAVSVCWSVTYIKKSGLFKPFPDAFYMHKGYEEELISYDELDDKEKAVYTALYCGVAEYDKHISLPYEIDGDEYDKLYFILEKQESSLFYLDSTYYKSDKIRDAKILYRIDKSSIDTKKLELEQERDEILSGLTADMSEFDKAVYIHDKIAEICTYRDDDAVFSSTAYGCLVEGYALCEGYAKAYDYLLKEAGISSIIVTGVTDDGENHAWNQIKIDGKWYNSDITWDDTDDEFGYRHTYMMCSDDEFNKTHTADTIYFEPMECNSDDNYFIRKNLYVVSEDTAEMILKNELVNIGNDSVIELKMSDDTTYDEFRRVYIDEERIFTLMLENGTSAESGETISFTLKENEQENCITIGLE